MIRIMQVGYGYWGTNVAKKLLASDLFELACLAESDAGRRRNAERALQGQGTEVIENYEKMLGSGGIDAVAVCTQTEYSFEIAMKAMACGKHVFIEKPIAKDVQRTLELTARAAQKGLVLHCDHLMIYNPVVRYIKKLLERNEAGDIMYIDISRVNLGPIRKDINAMLDLAVHDIAMIDYLVGGLEPDRLNAYGSKFFGQQETITYLTMKMGDMLFNINSSWISPVKVRRMIVAGTDKMLVFDDTVTDNKLTVYNSGIDIHQGEAYGEYEYKTRSGDIYIPHIEFEDSLQNSLEHFAGCVRDSVQSLSGPEQCLRVMKILEAAQKSLEA